MNSEKIFASCHNHSCFSDAEYSPEELVDIAAGLGHGGIILTDHDTVSGCYFIGRAARSRGMRTLLGCEFTTYHKGVGIHLCGFDFNPDSGDIREILDYGASVQTKRSEIMFKLGIERGTLRGGVEWEDVLCEFPDNSYLCNNQIFRVYLKKGIYEKSEYEDFFARNFSYKLGLEDGIKESTGRSYKDIETSDVIRAIKKAGGVPVVAHPFGLEGMAEELCDLGVMGFETRHSVFRADKGKRREDSRKYFEELCDGRGLYQCGGSDHEGELGGLLEFGDAYYCPPELCGITEERFNLLYERRLG